MKKSKEYVQVTLAINKEINCCVCSKTKYLTSGDMFFVGPDDKMCLTCWRALANTEITALRDEEHKSLMMEASSSKRVVVEKSTDYIQMTAVGDEKFDCCQCKITRELTVGNTYFLDLKEKTRDDRMCVMCWQAMIDVRAAELLKKTTKGSLEEELIMANKEKFCTVDIPSPEVAAYIAALIFNAYSGHNDFDCSAKEKIERLFPGGLEAAEELEPSLQAERYTIWQHLIKELESIGVDYHKDSPAPWVKKEWTDERHTEARAWCEGGGSKNREFTAALDEIERLQKEKNDE